jgi:Fungal Zn(2)-Cys(6) binuclear cluster domain
MATFPYPYPSYGQVVTNQVPVQTTTVHVTAQARDDATPVRRQNRSCDQCRKGKRRCDAVILRDWTSGDSDGNGEDNLNGQSPNGKFVRCQKMAETH